MNRIVTNIAINGMSSEDCITKVKTALENLNGVLEVSAKCEVLRKGEIDVTLKKPNISAETFEKAVADAGYEVSHFNNYIYGEITTNLIIKGMKSQECADKVKASLEKLDGVTKAEVSFKGGEADVALPEPNVSYDDFYKAVEEAGYKMNGVNSYVYGDFDTNIVIKGMHTKEDAEKVKGALKKLDGVVQAKAILSKGEADVTLEKPNISAETFKKAVADAGYELAYFNNYMYNPSA